ncbi:integral membrane protein [Botrytis cinerea]
MANTPLPDGEPQWNSKPQFRLPGWAEPIMVASILFGSMVLTRRHGYKIFDRRRNTYGLLSEEPDSARSSDDLLARDYMIGSGRDSDVDSMSTSKYPPRREDVVARIS